MYKYDISLTFAVATVAKMAAKKAENRKFSILEQILRCLTEQLR